MCHPLSTRIMGLLTVLALSLPVPLQAATWSQWRGADGDGCAGEPPRPLVDDLSQAKLVWLSDQELPARVNKQHAQHLAPRWAGGFASPVVADDRVVLFYYRPPGRDSLLVTEEDAKEGTGNRNPGSEWQADDVVHCFDAKTGRTLWKFVDPRGLMGNHGKEGGHYTPCIADGMVYALGSGGRLYGLDAATGEKRWENYINQSSRDAFERRQAEAKATPGKRFKRVGINACPTWIDGVVAISDDGSGVCGFDGKTGEQLWHVQVAGFATSRDAQPNAMPWHHGGRSYVIAANSCIEPRSGKVLFTIPDAMSGSSPTISGDYYLCYGLYPGYRPSKEDPFAGKGISCFRLTPAGAELLWSLEDTRQYYGGSGHGDEHAVGIIKGDRAYAFCRPVVPVLKPGQGRAPGGGNIDGKKAVILDLKTGTILDELPFDKGTFGYGPILYGDRIFGGTYRISMISVAGDKLTLQTERGLGEHGYDEATSPAIADGRIYFRGYTNLVCYDLCK